MPSDASEVSLGGETVKGTVAKVAMAAIGFVGTIVFARVLGPTKFGQYHLLLALVILAIRPVSGGWSSAAKKRASEANTDEAQIVGAQLLVGVLWIGAVAVVAFALAGWLESYTELTNAFSLFVVLLASKVIYESFIPVIAARGTLGISVGLDALRSYLTFPLQLAFVLVGLGVTGMAYGLAGATILVVPVALYFHHSTPTLPSRNLLRSMWAYARYSMPTSILHKTYNKFDTLLIGYLLVPGAVAQYEVAVKLTLPAIFLAEIASSGLMVRVSNLKSKQIEVTQDVSNVLAYTSIFSIPMFFGALALSKSLVVTIFGGEFARAAPLLVGLALFQVFATQNSPLLNVLNGLNRPELVFRISAVTLGTNVVLGVILALQFGTIGVVAATVVAEFVKYLFVNRSVRRRLPDVTLLPGEVFKQVGASVLMFAAVYASRQVVQIRSWIELSLLVTIGVGVYGAVLLVSSSQLRFTILSILRGSRVGHLIPGRW